MDDPTFSGYDFIFFDCDSTLSAIEGIDELARMKGKFDEVKAMTDAAMEGEIYLQTVYDRRLEMLAPTHEEIAGIDDLYRRTVVGDAADVVGALRAVGKRVFVVSGGLLAAVRPFARWLGVPYDNIRAVGVEYDELSGEWWDYLQDQWDQRTDVQYKDSEDTPLVDSSGKSAVVADLLTDCHGRSLLIGDGVSDLAARNVVDLFVGYTGVVARPRVVEEADVLITGDSLAPLLRLALSKRDIDSLSGTVYETVVATAGERVAAGELTIRRGVSP